MPITIAMPPEQELEAMIAQARAHFADNKLRIYEADPWSIDGHSIQVRIATRCSGRSGKPTPHMHLYVNGRRKGYNAVRHMLIKPGRSSAWG